MASKSREEGTIDLKKTPLSERKCQFCSEVEDEKHVVIRYPKYSEYRKTLFNSFYISEEFAFLRLDPDDKFVKIMQCKTKQGGEALARFLNQVKFMRGKLHRISNFIYHTLPGNRVHDLNEYF